jgi:DNA polymerase V
MFAFRSTTGGICPASDRNPDTYPHDALTLPGRAPGSPVPLPLLRAMRRIPDAPRSSSTLLSCSPNPVPCPLPLFGSRIPAGFPSPADDDLEGAIDLNEQLIRHPAATFFLRVQGDSMMHAGIRDGDLLVVDRSREAKSGSIVVAAVDGELTLKRLKIEGERVWLVPENPDYVPLEIQGEMGLMIWGVVAHVVHSF